MGQFTANYSVYTVYRRVGYFYLWGLVLPNMSYCSVLTQHKMDVHAVVRINSIKRHIGGLLFFPCGFRIISDRFTKNSCLCIHFEKKRTVYCTFFVWVLSKVSYEKCNFSECTIGQNEQSPTNREKCSSELPIGRQKTTHG